MITSRPEVIIPNDTATHSPRMHLCHAAASPAARSMRLEPLEERSLLSTLIALVDTGVELNGPYRPYYDLADAYNSQTNQFASVSGEAVVRDTHGHGRVLTNQTMQGVLDAKNQPGAAAADVKILPISYRDPATGATSYAAILRGIRHAADLGAAVINVSLGESWNFSAPGLGTISQAVQYAERRGSVVVAPAGNRGFQNQSRGLDVDRSAEWAIFPAFADDSAYNRLGVSLSNLLVAAAVDPSGNLTSVSNWGPTHVDVGALSNSEGVTSYAAGYASGVTGVIAALTPGWSAAERVDHMKQTVDPHPQAVGTWSTTGGNISAANAVEALRLPIAVDDIDGSCGELRPRRGRGRRTPGWATGGTTRRPSASAPTGRRRRRRPGPSPAWRRAATACWPPGSRRTTAPSTRRSPSTPAARRRRRSGSTRRTSRRRGRWTSMRRGRPWWALGGPGHAFEVTGTQLVVRLGNDADAGKYVIADGIRIERLDEPRVVDDVDGSAGDYARLGAVDVVRRAGLRGDHAAAVGVGADGPATATASLDLLRPGAGPLPRAGHLGPGGQPRHRRPVHRRRRRRARRRSGSTRPTSRRRGRWTSMRRVGRGGAGRPGSGLRAGGHAARRPARQRCRRGRYVVADAIRIEWLGAL